MADKQDKKTKITPEAPAGQTDNGSVTKHQREATMDSKNGDDAAPAAKKKTDEKKTAGGIQGAIKFLNDVKIEAKKITWPPRGQVINETWSVIVMVAFITFMVLGFDYALGNWIFGPIEHAAKMMAPSTPDALFQEVPTSPDGKTPDGKTPDSTPAPGTPAPGTPAPATSGTPTPAPGTGTPVTPGSTPEGVPPAGTMPGLPAPTSPSPPSTIPGATTPPASAPPATTAPAAPQTTAPGATTPSTTTPQAPATPTTPHP